MSDLPDRAEGSLNNRNLRCEVGSQGEDEQKKSTGSVPQEPETAHQFTPNPDSSLAPESWTLNLFETNSFSTGSGGMEVLNKITADLLSLIERTTAIEEQMKSMAMSLDQFQKAAESDARAQMFEIERLKEKLISDRKELIGRGTFNAIRPAIESLNFMIEIYRDRPEDEAILRQARSVLDLLTGITQSLGYRPFEVALGDEFSPHTMECSGYEPGAVGKVVRVDQPGYIAGDIMVRPCKVILGHT